MRMRVYNQALDRRLSREVSLCERNKRNCVLLFVYYVFFFLSHLSHARVRAWCVNLEENTQTSSTGAPVFRNYAWLTTRRQSAKFIMIANKHRLTRDFNALPPPGSGSAVGW